MSLLKRLLGIRTDDEIASDVEKEAPVRAARAALERADRLLAPLEISETRMNDDLTRADAQRRRRKQ